MGDTEKKLRNLEIRRSYRTFLHFEAMKLFALYFTTTTLAQDPAIYDFNNDGDYEGADLIMPKNLTDDSGDDVLGFDRKGKGGKKDTKTFHGNYNSNINSYNNANSQYQNSQNQNVPYIGNMNTGNTAANNGGNYAGNNNGNTASNGASGTYGANGATGGNSGNYGGATTTTPMLKCWTCRNAYSYQQCEAEGTLVTCQDSQKSCELEVRERNGYVIQVNTGCKQAMACENNKAQNFQGNNPAQTQCRPEPGYTHSVCRQCCYDDSCVSSPDFWKPATRDDWAY